MEFFGVIAILGGIVLAILGIFMPVFVLNINNRIKTTNDLLAQILNALENPVQKEDTPDPKTKGPIAPRPKSVPAQPENRITCSFCGESAPYKMLNVINKEGKCPWCGKAIRFK